MSGNSRTLGLSLAAIVGFAAAVGPSHAQEPAPPNVKGRVSTPFGLPLAGVEVRLEQGGVLTRTDEAGAFAFVRVPRGPQVLHFRRVGFLPATAAVNVPDGSDSIAVAMVPSSTMLDTVSVRAKLNVLAGVVTDKANRPVSGATVDIMGGRNASVTTDDQGRFTFTSVKSGPAVVRVRKSGFEMATHSIRLEDWRGLVMRLTPLEERLSGRRRLEASGFDNTEAFVWKETRDRLVQRGVMAAVVPREELAPHGGTSLAHALRRTRSGTLAMTDLPPGREYVCVLENGFRPLGYASLDLYRASDVEFVELYPSGSEPSGTVARYLRNAGCGTVRPVGTRRVGMFYAVVWTR